MTRLSSDRLTNFRLSSPGTAAAPDVNTGVWRFNQTEAVRLVDETRTWQELELVFRVEEADLEGVFRAMDEASGTYDVVEVTGGSYTVVERGADVVTLDAPDGRADLRTTTEYVIDDYDETVQNQDEDIYEVTVTAFATGPKSSVSGERKVASPSEWRFEFADGDVISDRVERNIQRGGKTFDGSYSLEVMLRRPEAIVLEGSLNRQAAVRKQTVPDGEDKFRDENEADRNTVRVTPPPGYALDYNAGEEDHTTLPVSSNGETAYTVIGWVNYDNLDGNGNLSGAFFRSFGNDDYEFSIHTASGGDLAIYLKNSGTGTSVNPKWTTPQTDTNYLLAGVKNGDTAELWADADLKVSEVHPDGAFQLTNTDFTQGRPAADSYPFLDGQAGGLAFYNRALSQSEQQDILDTRTFPTNGLVSRHPMDEGRGGTVEDIVGANDGTLNGPEWGPSPFGGGLAEFTTFEPGEYAVDQWEGVWTNDLFFGYDVSLGSTK